MRRTYAIGLLLTACASPEAQWGDAQSAYTERCVDGACADGSPCVDSLCKRPLGADDNYVPSLRCGDGLHQPWEPCDDGNNSNADDCVSGCRLAACGDGFLRQGAPPNDSSYEACDDGNSNDEDSCLGDCRLARCGDGVIRLDLSQGDADFEACDDGNRADWDACVDCQTARCGDGYTYEGEEECDDANDNDRDACSTACVAARCGDGITRIDLSAGDRDYEECDDGNAVANDACGNDCIANIEYQGGGSSADDLGHSCAQILRDNPQSPSGLYWIDPDAGRAFPPTQVRCDMRTAGGGFARMILVTQDTGLWDAWDESLAGQADADEPFGLPLAALAERGEDLVFYFARNGTRSTPIFSRVAAAAWDPVAAIGVFDQDGMTRVEVGANPVVCDAPLIHAAEHWNWSIASASGCAAPGAGGAVVFGTADSALVDAAVTFQGPADGAAAGFTTLSVWAR